MLVRKSISSMISDMDCRIHLAAWTGLTLAPEAGDFCGFMLKIFCIILDKHIFSGIINISKDTKKINERMRKMSVKGYAKKTAKKTARRRAKGVARGTATYVKYMVAYAVMAAIGGAILTFLAGYGIELPLDKVAVSAIAYFLVGTLVMHRRFTVGRAIKLGRGLGVIPRKMW